MRISDWSSDVCSSDLNRAGAIAKAGVPQVSVAVDAYFPRSHLIDCLRKMQEEFPTAAINLRITTMQGGENLVLEKVCALTVTIENVPEVNPQAIERHWLREVEIGRASCRERVCQYV